MDTGPKRSAQQAVKKIESYLKKGYTQVLDADLSGYFDSIPREELLGKVSRKISDESLMKLLKQMLKAPIAHVGNSGKIRIIANDTGIGTPQGSCLSPLLANIYLNDFCQVIEEKTPCRIITYADDFVILSKQAYTAEQLEWVECRLQREGLTLNQDKTHCVDMSEEGERVRFSGFQLQASKKFLQEIHLHRNSTVEEKSKEIQGSDTGDREASDIGYTGSAGGSCKPYHSRMEELLRKSRVSSQDIL